MPFKTSYITLCSKPKVFDRCRNSHIINNVHSLTHVTSAYTNNKAFKVYKLFCVTCDTI